MTQKEAMKQVDAIFAFENLLNENEEHRAARIAYEQQAVRAYEKMQATGLHVTSCELKKWADSLNTSTPKEVPKCHI